jgi:hypothetical protein
VDDYTCDAERRQQQLRRPDHSRRDRPMLKRGAAAHDAACARGAAERGVAVPRRGDHGQKDPARIMVFYVLNTFN